MSPTYAILCVLRRGPANTNDIASRTGIVRSTVSGTLNRMRIKGRVSRRNDGVWELGEGSDIAFTVALSDAWPMPVLYPPIVPGVPRTVRGVLHVETDGSERHG